ncbi:MAG TPA: ABC transporter ATP-binding protein [Chromatiaceae bacterium]|nr:ABC transporter ATP-binding protein [Chromatiaceae bacterium]
MSVANDVLLSVEHLTVEIGSGSRRVRPIDDVSFSIRKGEIFSLLGESGCGKSMTALSIMRLLPAGGRVVSGRILLDGQDLLQLSETGMRSVRGGKIGMIFQEPMTSLNPVMTVGAQISESLQVHDPDSSSAIDARVVELLDAVGIPDPSARAGEYPHQLSGGMKQRVMIAMALAGKPELLIADEPTTALDVTIQAQVLELLQQLQRDTGMAILFITHDLGVVSQLADDIAVMYAGELVEVASRDTFFENNKHPYSAKLMRALPSMEKRGFQLEIIPGVVPSAGTEFSGCRFADRCHRVIDLCRQTEPFWTELAGAHGVRCHFADPNLSLPAHEQQDAVPEILHEHSVVADLGETLVDLDSVNVYFPIQRGVLRRVVGHVKAVDGVSLKIPKGRTLALVGESGCGKTTLGKGLLQLIRPTAGSVTFEGDDLGALKGEALRERRKDFQIIFQDPYSSMNPRMQVGAIIEEGMKAQNIGDKASRAQRVLALLGQVGLPEDCLDRYPHEFSGGQRQRICIARALAVNPKLIVCDEPTSALDVSVQAQILNLLAELQQSLGLTYLFITHNISVVSYLAHEVAVMYLGRIVERGTVEEVLVNPQHPYTQALLSAVPSVDSDSGRDIIRLEGDLPSPSNPPSGCHFHQRCPHRMDRCETDYPDEASLSDTHVARCFLL